MRLASEPSVVGAWTSVSCAREDPATGISTFPWGEKQAKLHQTVTACSGTHAIRRSTMTVRVEVAGDPGLVGTDLAREVRIEGDLLAIRTAPMTSMRDGKTGVHALAWKRAPR